MPQYSEQDLERYEGLVADTRERIDQQRRTIDRLGEHGRGVATANAILDNLIEMLAIHEAERRRILEVLTR